VGDLPQAVGVVGQRHALDGGVADDIDTDLSGFTGGANEVEAATRRLVIVVGQGRAAVVGGEVDTDGHVDGGGQGDVEEEFCGAVIAFCLGDIEDI
jgi:hypothetical protein